MLLVLFAMVILSLLTLNVYKTNSSREGTLRYNEAAITATGLAQSMINEIRSKAFDQNTVNKSVSVPDSLTIPQLLGPDTGEVSRIQFNDIDDFNNYTSIDTLSRLGIFTIKVKVQYITNLLPNVISNVPTFSKQVNIEVLNFSLPNDTLKYSQVMSY